MVTVKDASGNEVFRISMFKTYDNEMWTVVYTDANGQIKEVENLNAEIVSVNYMPNVVTRLMRDAVENNYNDIIVRLGGNEFKISLVVCEKMQRK